MGVWWAGPLFVCHTRVSEEQAFSRATPEVRSALSRQSHTLTSIVSLGSTSSVMVLPVRVLEKKKGTGLQGYRVPLGSRIVTYDTQKEGHHQLLADWWREVEGGLQGVAAWQPSRVSGSSRPGATSSTYSSHIHMDRMGERHQGVKPARALESGCGRPGVFEHHPP